MRSLKNELFNILKPILSKKGEVFAEIALKWEEIIGSEYAKQIYPLKITKYHTNDEKFNILIVQTLPNASLMTLNFAKPQIADRINNYLGFLAISSIKIISK